MMEKYKKINYNEVAKETFELKPYMENLSYEEALLKFRLRGKVFHTVKTHFKNDKAFTEDLWSCQDCSMLDSSFHLQFQCTKYEDLRCKFNFDEEKDVVHFFRNVLERRQLEEDDEV